MLDASAVRSLSSNNDILQYTYMWARVCAQYTCKTGEWCIRL